MNADVEELLREGMERFTTGVRAPVGLAGAAVRLRRRRRAARAAVACGAVAVIAVAAIAVTGVAVGAPGRPGGGPARARTAAYVISRVETALATERLVLRGHTTSGGGWAPATAWVYGARTRFVEFTGRGCGHAAPGGSCTHHGGSGALPRPGRRAHPRPAGQRLRHLLRPQVERPRRMGVDAGPARAPRPAHSRSAVPRRRPANWPAFHQGHAGLRGRHRDRAGPDRRQGDHEDHWVAGHGQAAGRGPSTKNGCGPGGPSTWTPRPTCRCGSPARTGPSAARRPATSSHR